MCAIILTCLFTEACITSAEKSSIKQHEFHVGLGWFIMVRACVMLG